MLPKLTSARAAQPEFTPAERERQRVEHLVLGAPRPRPGANRRKKGKAPAKIALAPGVDEAVELRERWSHKANATPQTLEHVAAELRREGSLARLLRTGAIDAHQLAAAQAIREAFHLVVADVAVRTAKLEPRGTGGGPDAASTELLRTVIADRAYTAWRAAIAPHGQMLLAIIVDDVGLTKAARRWRVSDRRARAILVNALDSWRRC
ncbi:MULTISPECIES: hypothetical protein [Sphingomonas]|uniref:Uncharacterized protein n=1 Tax=Sphingomonas molluscorum TaxID=418184 RepID=A0ABU8Q7N5_9SPHN|nr:hypothetical protein [Sphingomonas sp. JUb134]MBM7407072.1 hypothetical protein [Sphingomonas sp. JUb134]